MNVFCLLLQEVFDMGLCVKQQAYQGAKGGWPQFFTALEQLLMRTE